ncbi:p53-like transcription factor [Xylariomycetidae sp. FL2044]|nr:p53-like transcription factor [Xylariomycetidae sp. FL2044]
MAHAHRAPALPNPGYSTRDLYSGARPSFGRPADHPTRSPSFAAPLRRHPLSPTPSPNIGFTSPVRMDYGKSQAQSIPPLGALVTHGQLMYSDGSGAQGQGTPIKIDIQGTIDKGFFLSEGEWTCYRRNYFSCVCSYNLTPHYPNATMQYLPNSSSSGYQVFGFAMCISAVVSDSDSHTIELVQHTPKRDKGPVARPEKARLTPKPPQQPTHSLGLYQDHHSIGGSRSVYEAGYGQSGQPSFPTEHTFERIQFKQATANNGKRRAAQQYYHLVVELYADIGSQGSDPFMKIAHKKSAKMIVRGRSPGHYQTERRGSTSSGPGGSGGMGGYPGAPGLPDYTTGGPSIIPSGYGTGGYDHRGGYGTRHHHHHQEMPVEPLISPEEAKAIDTTKEYQYYPTPIYEGADARHGIEMFSHRTDADNMSISAATTIDSSGSKVKHEYDGTLPSLIYHPGAAYYPRACSRFEGKSSSAGYYPTMLPQSG